MQFERIACVGVLLASGLGALGVEAQVLPNGERTIFLERGPGAGSTPMNIAHHPGFDQYYGSNGGNPSFSAWVWDSDGTRIQDLAALGIDARSWAYHPGADRLQVVSFDARNGGSGRGLIEAQTDGAGLLTGGTATILSSMPGMAGSQTVPGYDPANDEYYSRESSATVNVVSGSDGSLVRSFTLDLGGAGNPTLADFALGYAAEADLVFVIESGGDEAFAFDTNGAFVGASVLDITLPSSFSMGYANGQLFAFDSSRNGWQGYRVLEEGGLQLGFNGDCPGEMTFVVNGATPNGTVGFVYAFAEGTCTIPSGVCAGTDLDLDCASAQLGATAQADANGSAFVTTNVPPAACGNVFIQAIDAPTCETSNVLPI